jgi:transcriptional regulator with XRE-family HTH domain
MEFTMSEPFGPTLRSIRRDLGMSQEAVALAVGSTQRHISFLETGRSEPSRVMLGRLVTGLGLSATHRAALFASSGFRNPYPPRTVEGAALQAVLDLMAQQVLRHWPFPGFVVDRDWNFLRTNPPGARMVAAFGGVTNMHALFLSPAFGALVTNWERASASFYTRIQEVARRSSVVRQALDEAEAAGRFDHVASVLGGAEEVPVYVPIAVTLPGGAQMQFTAMHGRWASVHDAIAEGFEVELLVPLDASSERVARAAFGGDDG